jgi:hypothetical protein
MSEPLPEVERKVKSPFTVEQVESLNEYQAAGVFHPFTCGRCRDADETFPMTDEHLLTATVDGWRCPTCDYEQDWAWRWMADFEWKVMWSHAFGRHEPLRPSAIGESRAPGQ